MFNIFHTGEESDFSWDTIGNIAEGRKHLGGEMPVMMYRLFEYTIKTELSHRYGDSLTKDIFRSAGKTAGSAYAARFIDLTLPFQEFLTALQTVLREHKIGILRVETFDYETGDAVLTIGEDIDCSGLSVTGKSVCIFDEGFLAGILKTYTGREYAVTEIDCWASGSRVCRFVAKVNQ